MASIPLLGDLPLRRGKVHKFPAFGGDVRPAPQGPTRIQWALARLSFMRTTLALTILFVAAVNLLLVLQLIGILDVELIVSDGTVFGCRLPTFLVEAG